MPDDVPNDYDVVFLHSPTDDGKGVRVVRARPGQLEAGEVRAAKDGQPLNGAELVSLKPREGAPRMCDVEIVHPRAEAAPRVGKANAKANENANANEKKDVAGKPSVSARTGPAQVASAAYRKQWERVFGKN
jgi:hypothetical protein